ncbi:MAG TPA: lysine--tRNA ligase [Candidatus Saccharimonadales bacterium]|nr:lysine--tRNA ligase [Candidatus Saccharimonadales bacterium]
MQWLNDIVESACRLAPEGEILVESGISPSGSYHMGYLRELLICDAIVIGLEQKGRASRHVHFVDDQDGFRKVPKGLPAAYEKYLGRPLCDMPAPDDSGRSYADYALEPFLDSVKALGIEMDVIRSHQKYGQGFFVPAIERVLDNLAEVKSVLEDVSGRQLDEQWSPIQVNEDGYLKKRAFLGIDKASKEIRYIDKDGNQQTTAYDKGQVKLDWRLDWPARWWLLKVGIEPFGRDHATRGGSYDTGKALMDKVFKAPAPLPVPYEFINRAGESKKMSASAGTGILMSEVVSVLPPEVVRYFVLSTPPDKTLYFDPVGGVTKLIDEFAAFLAKTDKTPDEAQLLAVCTHGIEQTVVSSVPFSLLVSSYQAGLKDPARALEIIRRSEHGSKVNSQKAVIEQEFSFIGRWLAAWAPDEVKFELADKPPTGLNSKQIDFLKALAGKIAEAPADADGEWFHKAIYDLKDQNSLPPPDIFSAIYQALIAKNQGPRAGWFLSILPRDWLVKRLKLES